jgi:hypothetical protein
MVLVAPFAANPRRISCGHDQINLETNQVRGKLRQARTAFVLSESILDGDILSFNPAELVQLLPKRVNQNRAARSSA